LLLSGRFLGLLGLDRHQHFLLPGCRLARLLGGFGCLRPRGFMADALAQRLHQVDNVAGGGTLLRRDRLAGALLVDEVDQGGFVLVVCTENLIRVDEVMESPKLAE
jgi:hypothetical protein